MPPQSSANWGGADIISASTSAYAETHFLAQRSTAPCRPPYSPFDRPVHGRRHSQSLGHPACRVHPAAASPKPGPAAPGWAPHLIPYTCAQPPNRHARPARSGPRSGYPPAPTHKHKLVPATPASCCFLRHLIPVGLKRKSIFRKLVYTKSIRAASDRQKPPQIL